MTTILRSSEMSCPTCVNSIESYLNKLKGVLKATVHFNTGRIEVEHTEDVNEQQLIDAIQEVGYSAYVSPF